MREIRSALIVGAGAIGASLASRIYDIDPEAVALCAEGGRKERYIRDGFIVNGRRYDFRLADPRSDSPSDLIIVAVKSYSLTDAIEALRPYVGPTTTIISLLNGITSEDILRAECGARAVPLAFVIGIDALRVENRTDFRNIGEIRFGFEKNDSSAPDDRVAAVSRFFASHGIPHSMPADMEKALWFKYMLNVALNQWSALLRGTYGLFQKSPSARELLVETMKEVIALSDALGKGLVPGDMDFVFSALDKIGGEGKTSMLQDVEARRKTEVETFSGVIVEKSQECGLRAPINNSLLLAIRAMEEGFGI